MAHYEVMAIDTMRFALGASSGLTQYRRFQGVTPCEPGELDLQAGDAPGEPSERVDQVRGRATWWVMTLTFILPLSLPRADHYLGLTVTLALCGGEVMVRARL